MLLVCIIGFIWFLVRDVNFYPAQASTVHPKVPEIITPENKMAYDNWEEGRILYKSYCASCHNPTRNSLGPILAGATMRWKHAGSFKDKTGIEWMRMWIRNWKDAVNAGYPYAIQMARSREAEMNFFMNLTDKQIDLIMSYADNPDQFPRIDN